MSCTHCAPPSSLLPPAAALVATLPAIDANDEPKSLAAFRFYCCTLGALGQLPVRRRRRLQGGEAGGWGRGLVLGGGKGGRCHGPDEACCLLQLQR